MSHESQTPPKSDAAKNLTRYLVRLLAVLAAFGAAFFAGAGLARLLAPQPSWLHTLVRWIFDHGDYKAGEQSAVDALMNVGLSGAGATLVAVLRPRLDKLLDPVRVYLETGASFLTSVGRPALEVAVVSAGVFLGLVGATNVATSAFPKTYAKTYFDRPALERILAGVHCPGTPGALDVNAILAASEKVPLTIATKGLISLDLRQEPDRDRLAAAIDRLTGELAATPPVSHAQLAAMHGELTSIAGSLDRIKEHVSALAPHGVSQEP